MPTCRPRPAAAGGGTATRRPGGWPGRATAWPPPDGRRPATAFAARYDAAVPDFPLSPDGGPHRWPPPNPLTLVAVESLALWAESRNRPPFDTIPCDLPALIPHLDIDLPLDDGPGEDVHREPLAYWDTTPPADAAPAAAAFRAVAAGVSAVTLEAWPDIQRAHRTSRGRRTSADCRRMTVEEFDADRRVEAEALPVLAGAYAGLRAKDERLTDLEQAVAAGTVPA